MNDSYLPFQTSKSLYDFNPKENYITGFSSECLKLLKSISNEDYLFNLNAQEKYAFYERMAKSAKKEDINSLAALTLNFWLSNPENKKLIVKSDRIRNLNTVKEYLLKEVRPVFLSTKEAFLNGDFSGIHGVRDRILGINDHQKWNGSDIIKMNYTGQSFDLVTLEEFEKIQCKLLKNEKLSDTDKIKSDVFNSFHTSGLETIVELIVTKISEKKYFIKFKSWKSKIIDNYNWDVSEIEKLYLKIKNKKLTLLNPDYKNPYNVKKPVAKDNKFITFYHKNAKDVEEAKLAKSYPFETEYWNVNESSITAPLYLII